MLHDAAAAKVSKVKIRWFFWVEMWWGSLRGETMKKPKALKFINFKTKFRQQQTNETGKYSDSVLVLHEEERNNRIKTIFRWQ